MSDLFDNNKRKVISELLEVISKGLELLTTEHLDKNLYVSFERYISTTLKIVDGTFATNYESYFSSKDYISPWNNHYGYANLFNLYQNKSYLNTASDVHNMHKMHQKEQETKEYKIKLKYTLQQLVKIVKELMFM